MKSSNDYSYMFHTPNTHLAKMQAEAMGIPLVEGTTTGEKEKELDDLKRTIKEAKEKHKIQGIVTGALYSNYQRERIEKIADSLGLKIFSPLWHIDQETELRQILEEGYEIILSSIAADGLDKSWLGRRLQQKDVDKLVAINKKNGMNIAFEGGEAESLVLNGPEFSKRIEIEEYEIKEENSNCARFIVKKARLVEK